MEREEPSVYAIDEMVRARKSVGRKKHSTESIGTSAKEQILRFELRRADAPKADIHLELRSIIPPKSLPGIPPTTFASASILWENYRIRCLDYKVAHDVVLDGFVVGKIKGWHEHYWTKKDKDRAIREPAPPIKNFDLSSILDWCCSKWNIENLPSSGELF